MRINGLGQRSRQNQLPSHPCPAGPAVLYNAQFMFNLPRKVVAVFSNNTFIKEYQFYSNAEPTSTSDANNQISSIQPTVCNNFSNLHSTSFSSYQNQNLQLSSFPTLASSTMQYVHQWKLLGGNESIPSLGWPRQESTSTSTILRPGLDKKGNFATNWRGRWEPNKKFNRLFKKFFGLGANAAL